MQELTAGWLVGFSVGQGLETVTSAQLCVFHPAYFQLGVVRLSLLSTSAVAT